MSQSTSTEHHEQRDKRENSSRIAFSSLHFRVKCGSVQISNLTGWFFQVSHQPQGHKTAKPPDAFITTSPVSDPHLALPSPLCPDSDAATPQVARGRRRAGCWRRATVGHGGSGHRGEGGGRAGGREAAPDPGAPLIHRLHQIRLPGAAAGDVIHPRTPAILLAVVLPIAAKSQIWWANEFDESCDILNLFAFGLSFSFCLPLRPPDMPLLIVLQLRFMAWMVA